MEFKKVVEYGSVEYWNNRSHVTILMRDNYVNAHDMKYPCHFYTRNAGYKFAGSAAIWTDEVWGYQIFWPDGTITGKYWAKKDTALEYWNTILTRDGNKE